MSETTVDWDDPDMLRARANLIGWERNVEACYAKVGEAAGALDALRELRRRFPGIRAIDKAAIEVENGALRSAHDELKRAKASLAAGEAVWAKCESSAEAVSP